MPKPNTHIAKVSNFTDSLFIPLKQAGVPVDKLIRKHPLKNFDLTDPERYFPIALIYDFMHEADHYIGSPGIIPIISHSDFQPQHLGKYGVRILSGLNLMHFLQEAIKWQSVLASNLRMRIQVKGQVTRFSFGLFDPPAPGKEFADAINLLQIFACIKMFGGPDWAPMEIQVPGNSPKIIEEAFPNENYRITCGYPDFAFLFPTEVLTKENPFLAPSSSLEDKWRSNKLLSERIETLLLNYTPGKPASLSDFPQYFHLSTRTIRRALIAEGTNFREIKNRTLFLKSVKLLSETDMKVHEIAEYLGYEDKANFSRFFRRMAGVSPGKYHESWKLAENDNQ